MYNMTIQAQQVFNTAYVVISLSETDDEGTTSIIARAVHQEGRFAAVDEDPLGVFMEHVRLAVVKTLSSNEDEVWYLYGEEDRLGGGGWAGPGDVADERSESR